MANYGFYPYGYQPYNYPQNTPYAAGNGPALVNDQRPQNSAGNGIIWVSGEAGARGYPIAPNCTLQLWDSESQTIYLKTADAAGMPTMKILDYVIREGEKQNNVLQRMDTSKFVTKEELEKRLSEIVGGKHE